MPNPLPESTLAELERQVALLRGRTVQCPVCWTKTQTQAERFICPCGVAVTSKVERLNLDAIDALLAEVRAGREKQNANRQ